MHIIRIGTRIWSILSADWENKHESWKDCNVWKQKQDKRKEYKNKHKAYEKDL